MTGRPKLYGDTPTHKIGIILPVEVLAKLDRYAQLNDLSRSTAVAEIIDLHTPDDEGW